jgi:hypothetical protein
MVDMDDMIKEILYCGECDLIREDFVPETYPEDLQCDCSTRGEHEYLFW